MSTWQPCVPPLRCAALRCRHRRCPTIRPCIQDSEQQAHSPAVQAASQPGRPQANVGAAVHWQGLQHSLANGAKQRRHGPPKNARPTGRSSQCAVARSLACWFVCLCVCVFACSFAADLLERAGFIDEPRSLARPAIGHRHAAAAAAAAAERRTSWAAVRHLTATATG
jgi:hypothetical protein